MGAWLMDWGLLVGWLTGWVASIHPVMTAIIRHDVRHGSPYDPIPVPLAAAGGVIGAVFWPVIVPVFVSHFLYTGHRLDSIRVTETIKAKEQAREDAEANRLARRKQIEASYMELDELELRVARAGYR